MFSQLVTAAEEHPWLWVLYILTLALPVGLTVLFCWPGKVSEIYYIFIWFNSYYFIWKLLSICAMMPLVLLNLQCLFSS